MCRLVFFFFFFVGMYNQEDLVLKWEKKSPVTLAPELHLTEYVLLSMFTNETMINADLSDLRHGAFGKLTFYKTWLEILIDLSFSR